MKILSIIIPNYNHSRFLPSLFDSILKSKKKDFIKLILIDGFSNDGFLDTISKYRNVLDIVISEKDTGQANAINKGITYVDTKYWMWQNSDDYFDSLGLVKAVEFLKKNDVELVQCQTMRNRQNKLFPIPLVVNPRFLYQYRPYFLNNQSLIFNSKLNIKINEEYFYAFDLVLFSECIKKYECFLLYTVLGIYRSHDDTKTSKYIYILNEEMKKIGHKYSGKYNFRLINLFCRCLDLFTVLFINPRVFLFNVRGILSRNPW